MLVSVIVPTYNRAKFISGCVASILDNGIADLEIIVVDDGSTDDTATVVARLDGPVGYVRQVNSGPASARNRGFAQSQGRYVCFLDSDDSWIPGRVNALVDALEHYPDAGLAFGDTLMGSDDSGWMSFVDVYGGVAFEQIPRVSLERAVARLDGGSLFRQLARRNVMFLGSLMLRREAFVRSGGFYEPLFGTEDWDLFLRLVLGEPVLYLSHGPIAKYVKHGTSISSDQSRMSVQFILALQHVLEVSVLSDGDRKYVAALLQRHRFDWGYVAYDAGLASEARDRFVETIRMSGPDPKTLLYLLLSCAPPAVVNRARRLKRAIAG